MVTPNVGIATTYMCTVAQSLVTTLYTASEARVIREPIFFNPELYSTHTYIVQPFVKVTRKK